MVAPSKPAPSSFPLGGLRTRLTLLVLAGVAPAFLLILWLGRVERQQAIAEAHRDALRLVQIATAQQEQMLAGTQQFLRVLAMLPQVQAAADLAARAARQREACNRFLGELNEQIPLYVNLGVTDAEGNNTCSAIPLPGPVTSADRSWFQEAKRLRRFSIGDYQIGRISGKAVVVGVYPLLAENGEFRGVVFAALDLRWFNELAAEALLPAGSAVAVVDREGRILARAPVLPGAVGKKMQDAPLIRALLARQGEGTAEAQGLDGVSRLYAFAPLRATPDSPGVHVAIGIPAEVAFASANRMVRRNLTILALLTALALAAAWLGGESFILRPLWRLQETARRLGSGDLAARASLASGPPELLELASAMDGMAASLEESAAANARAQETLRHREATFRLLFASNPHPMWVYDLDTLRFLEVNAAAIATYGYTREEFLGMSIADIRPPEDVPLLARNISRPRADLEHSGEWRHRLKDGRVIVAEITSLRLEFEGRPAALVVAQDVTERKRAERALRLSEERFAKAFHASPDSITIATLSEGRFIEVNDGFERLSGFSRQEAIGRSGLELGFWTSEEERARVASLLRAEGRIRDVHLTFRHRSGRLRSALLSAEIVELLGEPCMLAVVRDVTDQLALEQQLRHAQKMDAVGRLAGGVAHDFNNLLMVILGHNDLLLERLPEDSPLRRHAEEVRKAARRAASLTQQLLTFSRKQVSEPRIVNPADLVRSTSEMLRRLIGENIELVTHLPADLWRVKADPGQFEQVLVNLAVNARDAMPRGGRLSIEASNVMIDESYAQRHHDVQPGAYVLLAVSDTGTGMDAATQARLFEPFFTTKEPGKGTGLGLATVYGIIKQAGGFVWVYSEAGRGTTFKVYLPRGDAAPLAEPAVAGAPGATAAGGTETILLVEDEEAVRLLARECLEANGYRVLEARHGAEAIELARTFDGPIHLLFTDVLMPGMTGGELAQQLAGIRPGLPALFASGYTPNGAPQSDLFAPGVNFLQKPFSPAELLRRVRELLDGN
jgi:two-component system cell cycle sensor histidine kinase/response regulator CckA